MASLESHAGIISNNIATASTTDHSASAEYDRTTTAEAGVGVFSDYGGASASQEAKITVSLETGTKASASAGLKDNTVYAEVSYSDATIAKIEVEANVGYEGVGVAVSGDVYAKSGTEVDAHVMIGEKGVDIGGSVSTGSCVGADASGTVDLREASVTAGGGCSVGADHFEAGAGGKATFIDGQATVGVSGELAAIIGLDVDVAVTIDTNQIKDDVGTLIEVAPGAIEEAKRVAEVARQETVIQAEAAARQVAEAAEAAERQAADIARKTNDLIANEKKLKMKESAQKFGNGISKGFRGLFH